MAEFEKISKQIRVYIGWLLAIFELILVITTLSILFYQGCNIFNNLNEETKPTTPPISEHKYYIDTTKYDKDKLLVNKKEISDLNDSLDILRNETKKISAENDLLYDRIKTIAAVFSMIFILIGFFGYKSVHELRDNVIEKVENDIKRIAREMAKQAAEETAKEIAETAKKTAEATARQIATDTAKTTAEATAQITAGEVAKVVAASETDRVAREYVAKKLEQYKDETVKRDLQQMISDDLSPVVERLSAIEVEINNLTDRLANIENRDGAAPPTEGMANDEDNPFERVN